MVDRDDIPQKIDLENTERAPLGDDPLLRFEEDDYSNDTKQKIGDYFRQKLTDGNNTSTAKISDSPGATTFDDTPERDDTYLAKQPIEARGYHEQIGNSGQFERKTVPGDKGDLDTETEQQASTLLTVLRESPGIVSDEVSRTISLNALHGPDDLFVTPDRPTEDDSGPGRHVIQSRLGTHSPQKTFKNAEQDPTVTISNLRSLGCRILLEASGEVYIPTDFEDLEQVVAAQAAAAAAPGIARLGFRIDSSRFGAQEVINKINNDVRKPNVEIDLAGVGKPTFGSVNNPLVPFDTISSGQSSLLVSTLLVGVFATIFRALAALLENANPSSLNVDKTTPGENKKKRLGHFVPQMDTSNPDFGLDALGLGGNLLIQTANNYGSAVQEGLRQFFGLDTDISNVGSVGRSLGAAATKVVNNPGYYNGILRLLVRSVTDPLATVGGSVETLVGGPGASSSARGLADYNPLVGSNSDPIALAGSVRLIKESKFLKFMNILASIGDVSLLAAPESTDESTVDGVNDYYSEVGLGPNPTTSKVPNPAALIKKSRLSDRLGPKYRNSLAWGADTLPSMYMINSDILNAEELFGETNNYNRLASGRNYNLTDKKRLPGDFVDEMEKRLDSYYMPFYFHDLRTNEIIAFHAFLDSVTDSHSAEYNESEGYGRIGKIYTYKNTNRSINLSFKVVAVNPGDFDAMWFKLNKLLMMLYPQYTQGRSITLDSQKFIQPFSQLPAASPMIRLRVGDLIKSNFSEFDLARLFGLGSSKFKISEQQSAFDAETRQRIRQLRQNITDRQLGVGQVEELPVFNQGEFFRIKEQVLQIGSREFTAQMPIRRVPSPTRGVTAARIREVERAGASRRRGGIPDVPIGARAVVNSQVSPGVYRISFQPALAGEQQGTLYEIDFSQVEANAFIRIDEVSVNAQAVEDATQGRDTTEFETTREDVANFFNPDGTAGTTRNSTPSEQAANTSNGPGSTGTSQGSVGGNPIFQSFRSTRGKGLAGFIKSLNFDWDGAVWETNEENSKAPRWCTITLEFAPVHDLNPGIDSNGNMTAPIYNIGSILQQMKVRRAGDTEEQTSRAQSTSNESLTSPNEGSTPLDEQ